MNGYRPANALSGVKRTRPKRRRDVACEANGRADISGCPLCAAGSTGQCNTARSLSAGLSKPKVFRGR